jgi:hypothetical protein
VQVRLQAVQVLAGHSREDARDQMQLHSFLHS